MDTVWELAVWRGWRGTDLALARVSVSVQPAAAGCPFHVPGFPGRNTTLWHSS